MHTPLNLLLSHYWNILFSSLHFTTLNMLPASSVLCFIVELYALVLKIFHLIGEGEILQSGKHFLIQGMLISR